MQKLRLLTAGLLLAAAWPPAARAQTLDPSLSHSFYSAASVTSALEQPDGKRVAVGFFSRVNSTPTSKLVRFNVDGTLDTGFLQNVGSTSNILQVKLLSNGQYLLTSYTNNPLVVGGLTSPGLLRLNADGTADPSFNVGTGPTSISGSTSVDIAIPLPNGQVLALGEFDHFNGVAANNIVRLNASGAVDATFNTGTGTDTPAESAVLLPSGKYLLGGYFSDYNGVPSNGLVRLNADGSLDPTFTSGFDLYSEAINLAVQPDGRILVAGSITYPGSTADKGVVRLLANGGADNTFTAPAAYTGYGAYSYYGDGLVIQPDGKILIADQTPTRGGPVTRLNSDGSLDATFQQGVVNNFRIFSFSLTPSGKILAAGRNALTAGTANNSLLLLNTNGTPDPTFQPEFRDVGAVLTLAQQADGKVLAGGSFTEIDGQLVRYLARFNPNGTLDGSYAGSNNSTSTVRNLVLQPDGRLLMSTGNSVRRLLSTGANDNTFSSSNLRLYNLSSLLLQPDGRVLVAGLPLGSQVAPVVRLLPNGSADASFTPTVGTSLARLTTVQDMVLQSNGKIVVAGTYAPAGSSTNVTTVRRLEINGAFDPTFSGSNFTNTGGSAGLNSLALQADGRIVVGGSFSAYGGTSRNSVARLNPDGTLDAGFTPPAITGTVRRVLLQPNGRLLLGGNFAGVGQGGNLARLLTNGTADASFGNTASPNGGVQALLVQSDGKIVFGGGFTAVGGQPDMSLARITAPNVLAVQAPATVAAHTEAWPVPAHEQLNVQTDAGAHAQSLDLLDLLGRAVRHAELRAGATAASLRCDGLPAGTYLLRVNYTEGVVARRVQIQ